MTSEQTGKPDTLNADRTGAPQAHPILGAFQTDEVKSAIGDRQPSVQFQKGPERQPEGATTAPMLA